MDGTDTREKPRPSHTVRGAARQLTLVILCLGMIVTVGSYLIARSRQPGKPKWCAGVGLLSPTGTSPKGALDAYLGHDSSRTWREQGNVYVNTKYTPDHAHGLQSVDVGQYDLEGAPLPRGQWTVEGGCV